MPGLGPVRAGAAPGGTLPSEGWMELSRSCSISALDYSEDTFESFSEEEEEEEEKESRPCGSSCPPEDLEGSAVSESTRDQSPAEELSEAVDSAALARDAMGKWIDALGKRRDLKNEAAEIKQDKSAMQTHPEIPRFFGGELDALRGFCSRRITGLRQQLSSEQAPRAQARRAVPARESGTSDGNCIVPGRLMDRILLQNTRETLKQVTQAQIHEPSACPDCQKKEAELAKIAFLRHKKTLMESALIQEKLEEHIYSRDVLTLLGEALQSLPKPSEDPRELWQRLKGQKM